MMPLPQHVSVALPVGQAIERVKRMLFQPFDLGKWFTIGFCAWLAGLGSRGTHFNFNTSSQHGGGLDSFRHWVEQARDYVVANLYWLLPLAAVLLLFGLAVWVLIIWLSSRGRFMFLHCVALNKAEVAVPWRKFAAQANRLFWFRLVVGFAGLLTTLPLLVMIALAVWRMIERGEPSVAGIAGVAGLVLLFVLVAAVFAVIGKLLTDFVVPVMFRRGSGCLKAWGVVLHLIAGNLGRFILYLLFQIVLGIATALVVMAAVLLTCCILCCGLMIPFLGTVLLLPVLVFQRSYSLYYLAQYGEEYDVFA